MRVRKEKGEAQAGKAQAGKAQAGKAQAGKAQAGKAQAGKAQAGKAASTEGGNMFRTIFWISWTDLFDLLSFTNQQSRPPNRDRLAQDT